MPRSNPRTICVRALNRWESERTFADELLHEAFAITSLSTLDRAFLTEAFYGVIRNLSSLDFLIGQCRDAPLDRVTRQILRLGLYQIFYMRVPHHAAVNETVSLADKARGVVNALLRRSIREEERLRQLLKQSSTAIQYSHPEFLIRRWEENFGGENTQIMCEWNNGSAEVYVRANQLKVTTGELLRTSPGAAISDHHPLMIKVQQIPFQWLIHGLCYVQDPSTMVACDLLAPQPGQRILDACAAPGGKTTYLAQLMSDEGFIAACDQSPQRLKRLSENLARLGVTCAKTFHVNWLERPSHFERESFDGILVDAPCSNTGVIRRRVDVRWRLDAGDFPRMQQKQIDILKRLVPLLKKHGVLVYSTCSIEPEENEGLVERVEKEIPDLRFVESRQTLPFRDRIDGAFAARFERV